MAVEALKGSVITNADATPPVLSNARLSDMSMKEAIGTVQASASASIASTYRLCRIPSNARISEVIVSCDAFDTTGAADIGIYQTAANGGAVVDADFFASAVVLTTALPNTTVTHESGVFGIEDVEKPLWEALGLSADPHRDYDVALTLTAANGAGATPDVTLRVRYGI
jgi:hypothetical protein